MPPKMTSAASYPQPQARFAPPPPAAPAAPAAPPCPDAREVPAQIARLEQAFKLDASEFADYLELPIQTFRGWRVGKSVPDDCGLQKIRCLAQIADEFQKAGDLRADRMLHVPGYDGRTLLDFLKAGEDYRDHLLVLIDIAKSSKAGLERLRLAAANTKPNDNWRSYISIPGGLEGE